MKISWLTFRYIIGRLTVGLLKQVTRAEKFLLVIRRAVYESDWNVLLRDAKHLICDIDSKIAEAISRGVTRNSLQQIQRTLEHRIKTSFNMVFPDFRDELTRCFRFSWCLSNAYISGTQILMDFPDLLIYS